MGIFDVMRGRCSLPGVMSMRLIEAGISVKKMCVTKNTSSGHHQLLILLEEHR